MNQIFHIAPASVRPIWFLLPIAILVASALRHRGDWIVIGVHFLIFPANVADTSRAILNFARTALNERVKLARAA